MNKRYKTITTICALSVGLFGAVQFTNAGVFYPYGSNSYAGYQNPCTNNSSHASIPLTYGKEQTPRYDRYQQEVTSNATTNINGSGDTINVDKTQYTYYKQNTQEVNTGYETVNGRQSTLTNNQLSSGWGSDIRGKFVRDANGNRLTGWQKISGYWYYFSSDGYMRTGWQKVNGVWYYLNSDGIMQTGWQKINGIWYYLGTNGAMKTGWQKISGKWYFLTNNGAMKTGWVSIGGKWYFLGEDGAMKTGWLKQGNKWYYLQKDGSMITKNFRLGTTTYSVNSSGACTW